MPQDGDIAPAGKEFVAPPPPRQPRTHTSPTIIQMLKGLSLASKLQRNKKIEAENDNRAAKSLDHEQDPEAHPEPRSETVSLITIDPKDLNRLKIPAIVATFREWIYPSLSVFLADEDVKEKVKRKSPPVLVLVAPDDKQMPEKARVSLVPTTLYDKLQASACTTVLTLPRKFMK